MDKKIPLMISCCGVDSVYGLLAQEVAHTILAKAGNPPKTLGLAYLVNGETEAVQAIEAAPCMVINGCSQQCASRTVDIMGGDIAAEYTITQLTDGREAAALGTAVRLSAYGQQAVMEITDKLIAEMAPGQKEGSKW